MACALEMCKSKSDAQRQIKAGAVYMAAEMWRTSEIKLWRDCL